ncbi:hypothetical protein [uncultured Gemella sp.]|uniref:hypothetical protein n=1 Tax=uncultured Gemella sp. TaxID=254352 RepID=UPI0028CFDF6A|nr:hypothetical protein [uncultured Gemella sp.]
MQLTASESNRLDWYIDDENRPVEAIKLIDEYLSSLTASDSDEPISIYFKFEKEIKSQSQRQRIEKHKANMYNLLVENGVLGKKQDETEVKIYKLELYKRLTEDVGLINVKIEVLKEKLKYKNSIKAVDYSKERVHGIKDSIDFSLNIISEIEELERRKRLLIKIKQAKQNILEAINNMQCTDELTKDIFKRRYIYLESWEEISNKLNQPVNSILIFHNSYLYFIEL